MSRHIVDDEQRRDRPQPPCALWVPGGGQIALPRRKPRSRDSLYFDRGLFGYCCNDSCRSKMLIEGCMDWWRTGCWG
jgi:hypothetical protein